MKFEAIFFISWSAIRFIAKCVAIKELNKDLFDEIDKKNIMLN